MEKKIVPRREWDEEFHRRLNEKTSGKLFSITEDLGESLACASLGSIFGPKAAHSINKKRNKKRLEKTKAEMVADGWELEK